MFSLNDSAQNVTFMRQNFTNTYCELSTNEINKFHDIIQLWDKNCACPYSAHFPQSNTFISEMSEILQLQWDEFFVLLGGKIQTYTCLCAGPTKDQLSARQCFLHVHIWT